MKKFLLYVWQLPQNLLGLAVIFFSKARFRTYNGNPYYATERCFGVSLGKYVIVYRYADGMSTTLRHEYGHQRQSLILGWLYLPTIGLFSALGNLVDIVAHKNHRKGCWYYKQPWEWWADKLGGVNR